MTGHDISGIVHPMITPFDAEGDFDERLHRAEVRHMLASNVHGVAVWGSTGEGHAVTTDETRKFTASTTEEVKGQIPVITGIICNSTQAAIERGER